MTFWCRQKVCGTLIELSTEADMIRFVIVGIGFNINMGEHEVDRRLKTRPHPF